MSNKIFINYRRTLNPKDAQLLLKTLERHFGAGSVFLDVKGLEGGDHWLHALERQVDASVAMVSLIGQGWANVRDEDGNRRIDNPHDFVRFEIARAFSRKIPVLPTLIDGAAMPDISLLPPNLVELTFPQAMRLRSESFDDDADKIAKRLKLLIAQSRPKGLSAKRVGVIAGVALVTGLTASPLVVRGACGLGFPVSGCIAQSDQGVIADLQRRLANAEATAGRAASSQQAAERAAETAEGQRRALAERLSAAEKSRDDQKRELAVATARISSLERDLAVAKSPQVATSTQRKSQIDPTVRGGPQDMIPEGPEGDALRRFYAKLPKEFGGAGAIGQELGLTLLIGKDGKAAAVQIVEVAEGSDADAKGLKPADLVLEINGQPVESAADIEAAVKKAQGAGRPSVLMTIKSGDQRRVVSVKMVTKKN